MKHIIFYDAEIEKAIPDRNGRRIEGIEYCEGWSDHQGMGITCVCAYDFTTEMPMVFLKDNLDSFGHLLLRDSVLIGFNNINFDNRLLAANGIDVPRERCFDLLHAIWEAAGLPVPGTLAGGEEVQFDPRRHGGYGLDACAMVNFNEGKSGDGALAPVDWQRGRHGKVISYCLRDVMLTMKVWRRMINLGEIKNPKAPERTLRFDLPQFANYKADNAR